MDQQSFLKKRNKLVFHHPIIMQESWLRNIRIVMVFIFVIGSKFAAATLPVYQINCVNDNLLGFFEPLQKLFKNDSSKIFMQAFFLFLFAFVIIATFAHFLYFSQKPTLLIMLVVFYLVKFFSDMMLILYKPEHNIWKDFSIGFFHFNSSSLFNSNVDPWTGIIYIFAFYFYSEVENSQKNIRIGIFCFLGALFFFAFFTHMIFQLLYSFSLYAALLNFVFTFFVSSQIEEYFFNRKIDSKDKINLNLE